jgi:hypothetical protein
MVPFKTKLKPVLMNKKHGFRPVLAILSPLATFFTEQQIKKNPKNSFFFCLCIFIKSNLGKRLILTKISNPIKIFKAIKHFDLKSAIL